jgi:predicted dehydrogenase
MKKVAIIGAGLQGKRRLPSIIGDSEFEVKWVVDLILEKAEKLAKECGAKAATDWRKAVEDKEVDAVLVLTYPNSHAEISISAMNNGKDVLCEKPLTKTEQEAKEVVKTAEKTKRILKCGFNHRHHPGIEEAYKLFKNGTIGKPLFGRSRYGIAGRAGLEKEWRSDPKIVSGGQLMEQGIHLVDLYRWFLGEPEKATGFVGTNFWPIKPLEDNGFGFIQFKNNVTVSVHSSLTQWINLFEFEIFGEKGSIAVQGLGSAYGVEKLLVNLHDPDGPFSFKTIEFRGNDVSWKKEWEEFKDAINTRREPLGNALDGLRAIEIVNAVYKASKTGHTVKL